MGVLQIWHGSPASPLPLIVPTVSTTNPTENPDVVYSSPISGAESADERVSWSARVRRRGKGTIESVDKHAGLFRICVGLPAGAEVDLERGASVSIDGVCLTVTELEGRRAYFDVMQESLTRTTLDTISSGAIVNIERAAKDGAEIGGHPLSGHIDCSATIVRVDTPHNNHVITFEVPAPWMRYIFPKGYIGLNGTSLTISDVNKANRTFDVWFMPETLKVTTFAEKHVGDLVNLEIERGTQVVVDTMRDFLEERLGKLLPAFESLLGKSGMSLENLADSSTVSECDTSKAQDRRLS